jgi:hypothetical protein
MRKIVYAISFDEKSFTPFLTIKMRGEDGKVSVLFREEMSKQVDSKYTPEQQAKINQVNQILSMNGEPPITEEECDYMVGPLGADKAYIGSDLDEEELQRLAGFKVEKKITYFNDTREE